MHVSMRDAEESRAKAAAQAKRVRYKLIAAMIFCLFFMVAEVVGGYLAHSLAIMTECVSEAAAAQEMRCY